MEAEQGSRTMKKLLLLSCLSLLGCNGAYVQTPFGNFGRSPVPAQEQERGYNFEKGVLRAQQEAQQKAAAQPTPPQ
jgi:hypothetical protein